MRQDVLRNPPSANGGGAVARGHSLPLDGLRGVAILLVLIHHCYYVTDQTALARFVGTIVGAGWIGVNLFFVLSGFLITGILLESAAHPHYYRNFYMRRLLRIAPLYYGFLSAYQFFAVVASRRLASGLPSPRPATWPIWLFLTNTPELFPVGPVAGPLGPLWSLAVEEQVYLVLPAIVALLPRRWLTRLFLATIPLALIWRLGILAGLGRPAGAYAWTLSCLDAFAAGGLVAVAIREARDLRVVWEVATRIAQASAIFLLGLFLWIGHFHMWSAMTPILSVGLTGLSLLFASVIAISVAGGPRTRLNRWLSLPILRAFGRYSFAMYLFHTAIFQAVRPALVRKLGPVLGEVSGTTSSLVFLATVALTFLAAKASWHLFEKPILRLKSAFPSRGQAVPETLGGDEGEGRGESPGVGSILGLTGSRGRPAAGAVELGR